MKKYKNIALITIVILIWGYFISVFYKEKVQLDKEKKPQYIILDNNFFWKYKDGKWSDLREDNEIESINWKKFNVYIDNSFYNTYSYVYTSNKAYFFDENRKSKKINNNNMLINNNSYLSIKEYKEASFNDDDYKITINFLNSINIKNENLTITKKFFIDDKNKIYIVSNYDEAIKEDNVYYVVFLRKNNKNYLIVNGEYDHNYNLQTIVNINKKFYNIILNYDCMDGYCYQMFQYDKEYKNVVGE